MTNNNNNTAEDTVPAAMDTSSSEEPSTTAARDLIALLDGNFLAEGKRTCRDCLRSKALPCATVVHATEEYETRIIVMGSSKEDKTEILLQAHKILFQEYTLPKERERLCSSLDCMNRLSVGLRFVQFLLLLSKRQSTTIALPSPAEVNKLMGSLLQGWTRCVCDLLRDYSSTDDETIEDPLTTDATQSLQAGPVFCYAFCSLLRMNNEYGFGRGALLVPLWKGLCDLAELLQSSNGRWKHRLPPNLMGDAVRILGEFLKEGKERLELEATKHCGKKTESSNDSTVVASLSFQGKFVGFLIARIAHLMEVYFSLKESSNHNDDSSSVADGVWRSLLGLRGMATALQLLYSTRIDLAVLRVYCEIAAKSGNCIDRILVCKHRNKTKQRLCTEALEHLLHSQMLDRNADDGSASHRDCSEDLRSRANRLSELGRVTGKVLVLQQLLQVAIGMNVSETAEAMLATIETLHSSVVPQCFSACLIAVRGQNDTLPTTMLVGSLQCMVRALGAIESSPDLDSTKKDAFYRLLVRWLAGTDIDAEPNRQQQHPMSRELVLSLLHAHIVGNDSHPPASARLVSYLTKLLMDVRTSTTLRRNIGALLVRLQSTHSEMTNGVLEDSFLGWLNQTSSTQSSSSSKKRSRATRDHQRNPLPSIENDREAVFVVSRVLANGGASSGGVCPPAIRTEIERLVSECATYATASSPKAFLKSAGRNALVLAWLERYILAGSTTAVRYQFRETTGKDLIQDVLCPVLSVISTLRFKGGDDDKPSIRNQKVMLYTAAMRLSTAAAVVFGDDGQLPIETTCLLLKHAIPKEIVRPTNNNNASANTALIFETLHLLGSIGKAIPSDCSDKVLKTIKKAFLALLSSEHWAVVSQGLSSVISFGNNLHESHQEMLGDCLPKSAMPVFQARASGCVWRGGTIVPLESGDDSYEAVDTLHDQLSKHTTAMASRRRNISGMLPTGTCTIAPGSYVLEMPTQEDRTAMVIFPPGKESLQDIRYMLGVADDDDESATLPSQQLKRAVATPNGGLKLLLARPR